MVDIQMNSLQLIYHPHIRPIIVCFRKGANYYMGTSDNSLDVYITVESSLEMLLYIWYLAAALYDVLVKTDN